MPRQLSLGNGRLFVNLDEFLQVREFCWPQVGLEDHAGGRQFRVGLFCDHRFSWLNKSWKFNYSYAGDSLNSDCSAQSDFLQLSLRDEAFVHHSLDAFLRKVTVRNPLPHARSCKLFFHQDFRAYGEDYGDTAFFHPVSGGVVHYKRKRHFLCSGVADGLPPASFACGAADTLLHGRFLEGTFRDAEDGHLSGNPIAQGRVDSTLEFKLELPASGEASAWYWIAVGKGLQDVEAIHRKILSATPEVLAAENARYWENWAGKARKPGLAGEALRLYRRSLLLMRLHCDDAGGIIAACDADNLQFNRDVYSYVWPRDACLVAAAFLEAGYPKFGRKLLEFLSCVPRVEGAFLHKYCVDRSVGSSWHAWADAHGKPQLPIQEDETALPIWLLARLAGAPGSKAFVKRVMRAFGFEALDFLASYRDDGGLPLPSFDLWEERRGTTAFACATVFAALRGGAALAKISGDLKRSRIYAVAAAGVRKAVLEGLWSKAHNRFARAVCEGKLDCTVDSSLHALWQFGLVAAGDARMVSTGHAIARELSVKGGGVARYENDYYHRAPSHAPNAWFICTLWHCRWLAETGEAGKARELFEWCCSRASQAGLMAEQFSTADGRPLSVSPLVWSHAEFVATALAISRVGAFAPARR
ncbi:MAG: glycoside hydrolase family 15 protein [Candidatus Micrarchaeota archaeon]